MADDKADLSLAAQRLEKAVGALEARLRAMKAQGQSGEGSLFDQDRSRLAGDLDASRSREKALETAAAEASAALGRAAEEVRAILSAEG